MTALVVTLAFTGPAHSAEGSAPDPAALGKQASEALGKADYKTGIGLLERVYALKPTPEIVLNIAISYDQWGGHCAEALGAFDRFELVCQGCKYAKLGKQRRKAVAEKCVGQITVSSSPPAAKVAIDGKEEGRAPVVRKLAAGKYTIRVELNGHKPLEKQITLAHQEEQAETITLEKIALAKPIAAAKPKTKAGKGKKPEPKAKLAPNKPASPESEPTASMWPIWTALGVGVAGLAAGGVFGMLAVQANDDAEEIRSGKKVGTVDDIREQKDTSQGHELTANLMLALGGVSLATAGVLALVGGGADDDDAKAAAAADWQVIPLPAGLGMRRAF